MYDAVLRDFALSASFVLECFDGYSLSQNCWDTFVSTCSLNGDNEMGSTETWNPESGNGNGNGIRNQISMKEN